MNTCPKCGSEEFYPTAVPVSKDNPWKLHIPDRTKGHCLDCNYLEDQIQPKETDQ